MLSVDLRVLYLHGFASSPASRKARYFASKFEELGFPVEIPDLTEGRFEALTVSGQLAVIERAAAHQPVILIGSSLGGYLAALYAAAHPEVQKLILLAPAFRLHQLWTDALGPEKLELWRKNGSMPILHYGEGREMPIGYQFMEDLSRYPPLPEFSQPALIFHGTQDPVVPVQYSSAYAASHPNVKIVTLLSGHELTNVLDLMWDEMPAFLLA